MIEREELVHIHEPLPWSEVLAVGFALLGPALAWGLHLNVSYFLVQPVCLYWNDLLMHAAGAVALLIALAAIATSARLLARHPVPFRKNVEGANGWKGFAGLYGMASGLLFCLAIIAQWTSVFVLVPTCG